MKNTDRRGDDKRQIVLEPNIEKDGRLFSPSAGRNRDAIRDVFMRTMPDRGDILELASGSGEHAVHLAGALPNVMWHGGDPDKAACRSLAAWIGSSKLPNLAEPHSIDVTQENWGNAENRKYHGMMAANMIHISPIAATHGLLAGAGRLLNVGGKLFLYGPFSRNGIHTSPSNQEFDISLKMRNPAWGVRDLDREISPIALANGLTLVEVIDMPANNMAVIIVRGAS